jgi:hypothetical protein
MTSSNIELLSFKGGIQKGTTAWDGSSLNLDQQVRRIAKKLQNHAKIITLGITSSKKLRKDQIPGGIGSCAPDGYVWFDKEGKAIAAFEAKKQGASGNAIERWFKNEHVLRTLNKDINYVTFTMGEGATEKTSIGQILAIAVYENGEHHFNKYRKNNNSIFMSVNGYNDEDIESIMLEALVGD